MRRFGAVAAVAAGLLGGGLGGCASQDSMAELQDTNRSLSNQLAQLRTELDECRASSMSDANYRSAAGSTVAELQAANTRLQRELDAANDAYRNLEGRIASIEFADLDPETDRALTQLAAQYPNLLRYDSARGMIRFASDLTFASGSADVQDTARASLSALSNILNSNAAMGYDIIIVGHTDAQPISSNTAQRHPTNMHLSCHRAIAVRGALSSMGVAAQRMQAAGWGETRPAVPNGAGGNTPENRRVEIYLTHATGGEYAGAETSNEAAIDSTRPPMQVDPTK
jgi:chemotaxis protein MotB